MRRSSQSVSKIAVVIRPASDPLAGSRPSRRAIPAGVLAASQVGLLDRLLQPGRCRLPGGLAERQAREGRRQRDPVPAVGDVVAAGCLPGHGANELLGHRHQRLIVAVRLVELHHRELGIVLRGDPLVPEVPIDLEDPLEAAHREPLQVQLRRDPQKQIHVERVVVRGERPRERPAGDRLHHRRLDLEIAPRCS